jgi:very-short-patch-repair endonuclease
MAGLHTPEVQAKRLAALRAAFKARPKKPKPDRPKYGSQGWRDKIGAANRGKQRTSQQRAEMSETHSIAANRPDVIEKQRELKKKWWATASREQLDRMSQSRSAGQKRLWASMTQEQRHAKISKLTKAGASATKAMWARLTPEEKANKLAPIWAASQKANPSSIEETVAVLLDSLGIKYQRQVFIGRCLVDFWLRDRKLVIECDGSYWHSLPGRPEQDANRDAWLMSRGFNVLRLPEPDIRSGAVIDALRKVAG